MYVFTKVGEFVFLLVRWSAFRISLALLWEQNKRKYNQNINHAELFMYHLRQNLPPFCVVRHFIDIHYLSSYLKNFDVNLQQIGKFNEL